MTLGKTLLLVLTLATVAFATSVDAAGRFRGSVGGGGGGGISIIGHKEVPLISSGLGGGTYTTDWTGQPAALAGDLSILVPQAVTFGADPAVACPSGYSALGSAYDSYGGTGVNGCYKFMSGGDSLNLTYSWTGTVFQASYAQYLLRGVTSVDTGASGTGGNMGFNFQTYTAPDTSRVTSGANRTLLSFFVGDDDSRFYWNDVPSTGATTVYNGNNATCPSGHFPWFVEIETGLASGVPVQRVANMAAGNGCTPGTASGLGVEFALVP
jgi:hypothetical protein